MLNTFAAMLKQIFLYLAFPVFTLFIERNPDFPIRRGQGAAGQACILAFNVEVTDLTKVK